MVNFLLGLVSFAWKAVLLFLMIYGLRWSLGKGRGTIKGLFETIGQAIQVGCVVGKKKLANRLRKEIESKEDENKIEARIV